MNIWELRCLSGSESSVRGVKPWVLKPKHMIYYIAGG